MKTALIVIAAVVIIGGVWYYESSTGTETPATEATSAMPVPGTETPDTTVVREFTVTGSAFKFDPGAIEVTKGETVRITFINSGGNHDWVLDEFNARTKVIGSGQSQSIEFVANKAGSFEYYCSVGNHRAMGMKGTLIVSE